MTTDPKYGTSYGNAGSAGNQRRIGTAVALPPGPKTLSAQFPGSSSQYDYFIPVGANPKVGDIILTSMLWGSVPGAGKIADRIVGKAMVPQTHRMKPRRVAEEEEENELDNDLDPHVFGDGTTITLTENPLSTGDQDKPFAIAAALAFIEKLRPAIVTRLHDSFTSPKANRFYVLDLSIAELHNKKQHLDMVIMRTVEQMKARARLSEIVREQAEMDLYRKVAETNPEAQRLIRILQGDDTT
jgi:hypothetical protein